MKIAFFGTPRIAQIILEKLISTQYQPSVVITAPTAKVGRGQKTQTTPVHETANQNDIRVLTPENVQDVKNEDFDLAILEAYGQILPKEILDIPKFGFVNIHPSLLPKYRGPSPIQSAILDGAEKTGVSIILLDEEVDHGPILAKKEVDLNGSETTKSLTEKLAQVGANLLLEVLPDHIAGNLKPEPQNHQQATFTEKIEKRDGQIEINRLPENKILYRMIRAYDPWPNVWTKMGLKGKEYLVKLLPDQKIQVAGKSPVDYKAFLNGYPEAKDFIEKIS